MSFEKPGLHNLDYIARYEQVLAENLPANFSQFAEFFAGTQRLVTLGAMMDRHINRKGLQVLNVGSGPFATEIFVEAMAGQQITALDYTPEFAPFHGHFRAEGHLKTTQFKQADVMSEDFGNGLYDLIILHDVLYENALDLEAVVSRLRPALSSGGILFLDFVNTQTRWIWRVLGKPDRFRRYDPVRVRAFLAEQGFEIVDWQPTHGASRHIVKAVHGALRLVGMANNYAVLARLKED